MMASGMFRSAQLVQHVDAYREEIVAADMAWE